MHRATAPRRSTSTPSAASTSSGTARPRCSHPVAIQVLCADKPGLLAHISQSFTDSGVNITQAHCRATEDGRAVNTFHASVADLDQLKSVIRSLARIKGVYSVDRVAADAADMS